MSYTCLVHAFHIFPCSLFFSYVTSMIFPALLLSQKCSLIWDFSQKRVLFWGFPQKHECGEKEQNSFLQEMADSQMIPEHFDIGFLQKHLPKITFGHFSMSLKILSILQGANSHILPTSHI